MPDAIMDERPYRTLKSATSFPVGPSCAGAPESHIYSARAQEHSARVQQEPHSDGAERSAGSNAASAAALKNVIGTTEASVVPVPAVTRVNVNTVSCSLNSATNIPWSVNVGVFRASIAAKSKRVRREPLANKERRIYFSEKYYKQLLLSYSATKWFCPPPELSPFLLARNGFKCTDTATIDCAVCGVQWTARHRGFYPRIGPAGPRAVESYTDTTGKDSNSFFAPDYISDTSRSGNAAVMRGKRVRDNNKTTTSTHAADASAMEREDSGTVTDCRKTYPSSVAATAVASSEEAAAVDGVRRSSEPPHTFLSVGKKDDAGEERQGESLDKKTQQDQQKQIRQPNFQKQRQQKQNQQQHHVHQQDENDKHSSSSSPRKHLLQEHGKDDSIGTLISGGTCKHSSSSNNSSKSAIKERKLLSKKEQQEQRCEEVGGVYRKETSMSGYPSVKTKQKTWQVAGQKHVEKEDQEDAANTNFVSMDAVALSFLHSACCPWRNFFTPLSAIGLEGAALQPAALIYRWTKSVHELRRAAAAASASPAQARAQLSALTTLQSARTLLLSALMAAAEAAAEERAEPARAPYRGTTSLVSGTASVDASSVLPQDANPADEVQAGAIIEPHRRTGSLLGQGRETGDTPEVQKPGSLPALRASCFFSSPHSPLQPACVNELSKREMHVLREVWLFISDVDKNRERFVRKDVPSGTVILPVSAPELLLEKKCALMEGSKKYKEAGEYLSLPVLETLLHQIEALLFDPRVPLPGSATPTAQLAANNSLRDEMSLASFTFPSRHESLQLDSNKILAFFGWAPVTTCTNSTRQRHTTAPEKAERQQLSQDAITALGKSDQPHAVPQQPQTGNNQRSGAIEHSEAPLESKETTRCPQQCHDPRVGLSLAREDVPPDKDDEPSGAATSHDVTMEKHSISTALQCQYCFRRVELMDCFSGEGVSSIGGSTSKICLSSKVDDMQKGEKPKFGKSPAEGWGQRKQVSDERMPAKEFTGTKELGEESARLRHEDNRDYREKRALAGSGEDAFSKTAVSGAGKLRAVSDGRKSMSARSTTCSGCLRYDAGPEFGVEKKKQVNFAVTAAQSADAVHTFLQPTQTVDGHGTKEFDGRVDRENRTRTVAAFVPSFDLVGSHRLHCPYVCNAVYKENLPVVLKLLFALLPSLMDTLQLQEQQRQLRVEIEETCSFNAALQLSERKGEDVT